MDADLQHPPELLAPCRARRSPDADLVVGEPLLRGGDTGSFSWARAMASRFDLDAARLLFPRRLRRERSDERILPRAARGARSRAAAPARLQDPARDPVRHPGLRVSEVPFSFGERRRSTPRPAIGEGVRSARASTRLRFARFGVVGATGLVVNTRLLAFFTELVGIFYVVAAILATQGSTLWNFCLTELWVFSDRERGAAGVPRGHVLRDEQRGAGAAGAAAHRPDVGSASTTPCERPLSGEPHARALRAGGRVDLGEGGPSAREADPYSYDIHGIVTVTSEVRLPELERFRVGRRSAGPDIRVRLGRIPPTATAPSRRHPLPRGPWAFGFGVEIGVGSGSRRSPRRWSGTRRTFFTRTWSSRSCGGHSRPAATRSFTRRASRTATTP